MRLALDSMLMFKPRALKEQADDQRVYVRVCAITVVKDLWCMDAVNNKNVLRMDAC